MRENLRIIQTDPLPKPHRASRHLEDLQAEITKWLEGDNHRVWTEKDPNRADYFIVRVSAKPMPVEPFATLIGDTVHNLRGSLDHLVYALSLKHSVTLSDELTEKSQFPIIGDKSKSGKIGVGADIFRDNGLPMIQSVAPAAQAIIQKVQPYHRGNEFAKHPLWKLRELSNIDKHRLLISAVFCCRGLMFRKIDIRGLTIGPMKANRVFVEGETEIGWYKAVRVDPCVEVDMQNIMRPDLEIVFRYGGAMDGKVVLETLSEIHSYIMQDVAVPLAPFM